MTLIGVTGATGEMGGRVARRLAAAGATQRLVVRDATRAPQLDGAQVRVVPTGYASEAEMRNALAGVDTLFLVPASEAPDRIEQHRTAVRAAAGAGVERIVYLSFVGASPDNTFTLGRHHWATEEAIKATGLPWTFVRMNLYMDFIPYFAGADGIIRGPAGDGRVAAVHRDDLADVCARVLLDEPGTHDGEVYEVTGPEAFSLQEIADLLGAQYVDETEDEAYRSRAVYGAPDWEVEGWVTSYLAIKHSELDVVTDTVERLTGHPAMTLQEFMRRRDRASD